MVRQCILATALIFLSSVFALADERRTRLDEVNVKITELQAELSTITEEKELAESELKKVQYAIRSLTDREAKIKKDLNQVKASRAETENILREIEHKIYRVEALSAKRLQALYMMKGEATFVSATHMSSVADLDRASIYLTRVREFDRKLVEDMRLLRVKRDSESSKLTELQKQQSELLAQLELQRREFQAQMKVREEAVSNLRTQKTRLDETLLTLKAQSLRLETVLRSLTGGQDEEEERTKPTETVKVLGFEGPGLTGKGMVVVPFRGKIVQKFGKKSGPDKVLKKGVEYSGAGPVVAIAEGRVAYLGKMAQLGQVVILDHGKRDYSLYGRLRDVTVRVGDTVSRGEALGEASSPDEEGRTFYLEVRRAGTPVDPMPLFK